MTESNRATSEQEKTSNIEPLIQPSEGPQSSPSSPIGVYAQAATPTTSTTTASSKRLGMILLIVLMIILAFWVLRGWM